jgi:hypothetical protein
MMSASADFQSLMRVVLMAFCLSSGGLAVAAETLTRIADVRKLRRDEAALNLPVKVRGGGNFSFR